LQVRLANVITHDLEEMESFEIHSHSGKKKETYTEVLVAQF
jgi:hypothetical protein